MHTNPGEKMINITMSMTYRKKIELDFLKQTHIHQTVAVRENIAIFVVFRCVI